MLEVKRTSTYHYPTCAQNQHWTSLFPVKFMPSCLLGVGITLKQPNKTKRLTKSTRPEKDTHSPPPKIGLFKKNANYKHVHVDGACNLTACPCLTDHHRMPVFACTLAVVILQGHPTDHPLVSRCQHVLASVTEALGGKRFTCSCFSVCICVS